MVALEKSAADDPQPYKQTIHLQNAKEWKETCALTFVSVIENMVYEMMDRQTHEKLVTSKWVFDKKKGTSARMVAREFTQQEGVDNSKTFALPIQSERVRLMLEQAAAHNIRTVQIKVTMYADLREKIYLQILGGLFGETM